MMRCRAIGFVEVETLPPEARKRRYLKDRSDRGRPPHFSFACMDAQTKCEDHTHPYSDGFGLTRDVQNAKEQIFVTGKDTGWFVYNLVVNLAGIYV